MIGRAKEGRPGSRLRNSLTTVGLAAAAAVVLSGSAAGATRGTGAAHAKARPRATASRTPFGGRGRGLWIWMLSQSDGGNLSSIVADAHRFRIGTVTIKAGDGATPWSQFNSQLVSTLHANGLRVCAWQYVYGEHPAYEAQVGAAAVAAGADCLAIDAETEYEGRYVQAQTFITQLRKLIGQRFPVALAGFPYIDYHPGFPYSVFLGPGGAQYNTPQMYWSDIGTSVDAVYAHTYEYNRLYGRPIDPVGQVFNSPPASQVRRFRQVSRVYGAAGVSWWDWQEASWSQWHALSQPVGPLANATADTSMPVLRMHARGDLVVWAQEHLVSAAQRVAIDGAFGPKTRAAVESFQNAAGLPVTGVIDQLTWPALLRYQPIAVKWTRKGARAVAAAAAGGVRVLPVPKSASLRPKRDEIPGAGGAGL